MHSAGKYLIIGLLVGIGFSLVEFASWKLWKENELLQQLNEARAMAVDLRELFYVEESNSIFSNPKDYNDGMGINFSLQEYQWEEDRILVSGIITNNSVSVWTGLFFEFEMRNRDGDLIAECSEHTTDIAPGDWEAMIVECPVLIAHQGTPPKSIRFVLSRAFHDKTVLDSNLVN